MDQKTRLLLLHILLALSSTVVASSQIHFPQENNKPLPQAAANAPVYVPQPEELLTDLTTIERGGPISRNTDQEILARGICKLTLDINRVLPTVNSDAAQADHLILGPVTITGALALVLLASVGRTFDELANFLGLNSLKNAHNNFGYIQEQLGQMYAKLETNSVAEVGQLVTYATGIFVQKNYPLRPAFEQVANVIYKGTVKNVDFQRNPTAAQKFINDFISERTHNRIPVLFSNPPPRNTRSIITSVFYFKAAWEYPFYNSHTKLRPFFVNGRNKPSDRMVEMMSNGGEFPYYKDNGLGVQILGFPYKGKRTTMYVILPNNSNKERLKAVENALTPNDIERLVRNTKYTEAVVLFPKMKLESTFELSSVLQTLGVVSLFNPLEANLALLTPGDGEKFNPEDAPFVSPPIGSAPSYAQEEDEERLIFTRFGAQSNCIFDYKTNSSNCQQQQQTGNVRNVNVRSGGFPPMNVLENLRYGGNLQNPGLYADQVIHKVYIDITESGTEAASATGVSSNRSGGRVTFRADAPFIFFIYHEETKAILFWGSVKSPSPSVLS